MSHTPADSSTVSSRNAPNSSISSKASGIEQVTEHLGIARRDTLAIGDSDNDLEMLRHAGVGIAMGNARQHVREAADEVTSPPEEGGVHEAFVRHGLIDA